MMWLFLMAAMPIDTVGDPLPRYLTTDDVRRTLGELLPKFRQCTVVGEHTEPVDFSIRGNGTVVDIRWANESSDAQLCWNTVLSEARFQVHDDTPVQAATTLYVRDNKFSLSPQVQLLKLDIGPLMLFVLPEKTGDILQRLDKSEQRSDER